jgi:predicted transcriptional regulator
VTVQPLVGALRRYDPATRSLGFSEALPRESRGFRMALQLALLGVRDPVDAIGQAAALSSSEAAMLIRIGLLNYAAAALLMPYEPFLASARGAP